MLTHFTIGKGIARIRKRRGLRRRLCLFRQQAAERLLRQWHSGLVHTLNQCVVVIIQQIRLRAGKLRFSGKLCEQMRQTGEMALNLRGVIALLIREQFQRHIALFVDIERDFEIFHRPRGELVGYPLHAIEIEPVIKHFQVQHRAIERRLLRHSARVAQHLLGVIALMTAQRFERLRKGGGELRQRLSWLNAHRARQHVQHRAGGAQRGRADAAHKDETGAVGVTPAQAAKPERHQRQRHVRRGQPAAVRHKRSEMRIIKAQRTANQRGGGRLPGKRLVRERRRRRQFAHLLRPEGGVACAGV